MYDDSNLVYQISELELVDASILLWFQKTHLRGYFSDVGNFGKLKTHANSSRITNATLKFDTQITLTTERQN